MASRGVVTAASLRVRAAAPDGLRLGALPKGTVVEIVETVNGWHRIRLYPNKTSDVDVSGWVSAEYIRLDNPRQVPVQVRVGVNVLNRHEEVALPMARRGCRYFMIFNNVGFATRLKNEFPDAIVMVRYYFSNWVPSIERYLEVMDGCRDSRLIYTGLNEAEGIGQGGSGNDLRTDEIRRRAEFDVNLARRIKSISGATYAAGTFSMGTPDFTKQAICDVMREAYAPHYNSGLISWDHHLYSPDMSFGTAPRDAESLGRRFERPIGRGGSKATWVEDDTSATWVDPIWFESRWRWLFTKCGFNPASASRVYCGETGVDQGGVGGFPAHGATSADVLRWARFFIDIQSQPVVVAGTSFASPFVGGAIFQVGNREDWAGYNVEGYVDALAQTWV